MATRFYINPEQDIISVIHRLLSVNSRQIILNIPPAAKIIQDPISLKILKREAQEMQKEIIIATADAVALKLAREAGLEIYQEKSIKRKLIPSPPQTTKDLPLEYPPSKSFSFLEFISGKYHRPKKVRDPLLSHALERKWQDKFSSSRSRHFKQARPQLTEEYSIFNAKYLHKIIYLFLAICLLTAALVSYLVLPRVKIEILAKQELLNFELTVVADTEANQIDLSLNKIPGQLISVSQSQSQEFEATEERYLDSKAKGKLRVYNNYNSQEQVLVANTRFIAKDTNFIFRLQERVLVPPATIENGQIKPNFIEVEIEADQPGAEYNLEPTTFKIPGFLGSPKYEGFYGQSLEPMAGGSKGQVKVVSENDIVRAKESLSALLLEAAGENLAQQVPTQLKFVPACQSQKLVNLGATAAAGNPQDKFIVNGEIKLETIVFKEQDLKDLLGQNILAQIADNKQILPETLGLEYLTCRLDPKPSQAQLKLRVQEKVAFKIDQAKLAQDLVSKDAQEIENYFRNQSAVDKVRVSFWPFWVRRVPKNQRGFELKIVNSLD